MVKKIVTFISQNFFIEAPHKLMLEHQLWLKNCNIYISTFFYRGTTLDYHVGASIMIQKVL